MRQPGVEDNECEYGLRVDINQTWYICFNRSNNGTQARYTKESYDVITTDRWY